MSKLLKEAIDSIGTSMIMSPRDWGLDHRDAWVYGIVLGWNSDSLAELRVIHRWDDKTVERLTKLRSAIEEASQ